MTTCRLCNRPSVARSLCAAHYQRQRRHGDPLKVNPAGRPRKETAAQVAEEVGALEKELEAIRLSLPQKYQSQIAKAHAILQRVFQMGVEKLNATIDERLADRKAEMEKKIAAADDMKLRYTKLVQDYSTFMTYKQFRQIRACLHSDRQHRSAAELDEAFAIFNKLESAVNKHISIADLRERGWAHVSPFYKPPKK